MDVSTPGKGVHEEFESRLQNAPAEVRELNLILLLKSSVR